MTPHLPIPNLAGPHATERALGQPVPLPTYTPQFALVATPWAGRREFIHFIGAHEECARVLSNWIDAHKHFCTIEPILWGTRA